MLSSIIENNIIIIKTYLAINVSTVAEECGYMHRKNSFILLLENKTMALIAYRIV